MQQVTFDPALLRRSLEQQGAAPSSNAPIFISGCNRGGTTLISRLLAAHPEVRNVGRGQFNEGLYVWRKCFPDYSRHRWALPPWRWYLRRTDAPPATLRFLRESFEAACPGDGRMLEKTPANAIRIPLIDRLYPDCHFIHVLRDGRHTTASLIARRVMPLYAPHQWVSAHQHALGDLARIRDRARVTLVRYEEVVERPEEALGAVCRSAGLGWGPRERDAVLQAASQIQTAEARWRRLWKPIRTYTLRVIGPMQRELGYPDEL